MTPLDAQPEQALVNWDALVASYLSGNAKAGEDLFEQILRDNIPKAVAAVDRSLTAQDRADIAKRVETKLFDQGGLSTYQGPNLFLPWLRQVCRSERASYFRTKQRTRAVFVETDEDPSVAATIPDDGAAPDRELVSREICRTIHECIARLNADEQRLVKRRLLEGADYASVAAELGRTIPQVQLDVHRVRKKLAALLAKAGIPGLPKREKRRKDLPPGDVCS